MYLYRDTSACYELLHRWTNVAADLQKYRSISNSYSETEDPWKVDASCPPANHTQIKMIVIAVPSKKQKDMILLYFIYCTHAQIHEGKLHHKFQEISR